MHLVRTLLAVSLVASAATSARADGPQPDKKRFRTEQVWVDPAQDVAQDARTNHISHTLYINRCVGGCNLTPGDNDARLNTSSIIPSATTITEFDQGDEIFAATVACIKDVYAPYNVDIVTEDPGTELFHHEAILAGFPEEVGRDPLVGGVAPASCEPLNNVISFSFANSLGQSMSGDELVETLCWTLSQESAHSFGLPNHVFDCLDPMTYLEGPCGRKYFRNRGIGCGEFEPLDCNCGGNVQNSHQELLATFGEGSTPVPGPTVALQLPAPDAQVADSFSIFFTALDPRLVEHVDIIINGTTYQSVPGKDYQLRNETYSTEAPALPDGYIDLEVRAYNEIGSYGSATATVLKGSPCTTADSCFPFQSCSDGRCSYPPPSGALGDDCEYDQFCLSSMCAQQDGEGICSQACTPGVSDACPEGYECADGGYCWVPSEGGGCCTVAGGQQRDERFPLIALGLFGAVLAVMRLRVSRRRAR